MIFNDKAYVGNGEVIAIDLATGQKDQNFNFLAVSGGGSSSNPVLGAGVWNAPATDGTAVYFTTGNVMHDDCGNNPKPTNNHGLSMIRVDKDTGDVKWQLQPAAVMNTKNCGELIASVQKDGWSYAADPASGTCRWQFPPVNPPITEPNSAWHMDRLLEI